MSANILVLSASVGAGHMRAAQAVELALRQLAPRANVKNVDILTLTSAPFRKMYGEAYLDLVNKVPHVLGYIYDYLDKPRRPESRRDKLRLVLEKLNLKKFRAFLQEGGWDVVVNTHFLPAEIIASLRRDGKLTVPQITVTTDFETHRLWFNEPCEHYTTATAEGAAYLAHWGVPRENVTATGIPIHPLFSQPKDRQECLKRQGLLGDRPVVVQLAGGFGVGPIEKLFRGLLGIELPLQIVVVAGRNESARRQLEQVEVPERHRAKVLGFTDQIDELMAAADVVMSKPGGLTTSEVLARGRHGDRQSHPRPGEPQQRLPPGKRGRDQNQQRGHAAAEVDRTVEGPGPAGVPQEQRPPNRQTPGGVRRRETGAALGS